ncbi:MAG: YitT family protein [Selenomonadales bacterium]|nr:YitT family protein [Selenomonadales bacterium]
MEAKNKFSAIIKKYLLLTLGAIVYAAGLETFFVPNNLIDGGVVGISMMISYLTDTPLSVFVVLLNIPFLYLGYKQIGKTFTISTLYSIVVLAFAIQYFHTTPNITYDIFLATIFGGIVVGLGGGIIIRYGGSVDGTEIVAIISDRKTELSVGETVMIINLFILSSAGLVFGWERAMYSLIAYFIAYKVMDLVISGLEESKGVMIVSDRSDDLAETLLARLGRGVTILHGEGAYTNDPKRILYTVVTRLEVAKLKAVVKEKDPNAFLSIYNINDVVGGRVKKKSIH